MFRGTVFRVRGVQGPVFLVRDLGYNVSSFGVLRYSIFKVRGFPNGVSRFRFAGTSFSGSGFPV